MNDPLFNTALVLEPGNIYALECKEPLSRAQIDIVQNQLDEFRSDTGVRFFLVNSKLKVKVIRQLKEPSLWCENCSKFGIHRISFGIYYKDRNPSNNDQSNLQHLCKPCIYLASAEP